MIVCPNCNHQNPDGAAQCEACYTPLPSMRPCPNCGTSVQVDANFCGQCGSRLVPASTQMPNGLPKDFALASSSAAEHADLNSADALLDESDVVSSNLESVAQHPSATAAAAVSNSAGPSTQLQQSFAKLLHIQTGTVIELSRSLAVIHVGKPNNRVPADIDVSGFPDSDVVSRIHADIRIEGDLYYIEDVGSANGTYINNMPLPPGSRHRLRTGDRISLGKGDLVTFLFQQT